MAFSDLAVIIAACNSQSGPKYLLPAALASVSCAGARYVVDNFPERGLNAAAASEHNAVLISPGLNLHHVLSNLIGLRQALADGFRYALLMHDDMEITDPDAISGMLQRMIDTGHDAATFHSHAHPDGALYWDNWMNFGLLDLEWCAANPAFFRVPFAEKEDSLVFLDACHFAKDYEKYTAAPKLLIDRTFRCWEIREHVGFATIRHEVPTCRWHAEFNESDYSFCNGVPGPVTAVILARYGEMLEGLERCASGGRSEAGLGVTAG